MSNIPEIVRKLTGSIQPIGESNIDSERLENIELVIELTESLINDLISASQYASRYESSMKAIGAKAKLALKEILESIECNIDEE